MYVINSWYVHGKFLDLKLLENWQWATSKDEPNQYMLISTDAVSSGVDR